MSTIVVASLFESPWVLLVIVLVGALSQWLTKRRQASEADSRPDNDAPLPSPGKSEERLQRELDLQEVLRQLLGGEPPPRAPQPPPISPVMRDAPALEVGSDEEPVQPEHARMDKPQETYEAARPAAIHTAPSRPYSASRSNATPITISEQSVRRFEPLVEHARHPAAMVTTGRERHSHGGARAIGWLRDHQTVRQAFVASLVFGPPKAFES